MPARAYLTGAAAGALMGRIRPSLDIDLGLELLGRSPPSWDTVEGAMARTTKLTGIPASVAEDIDRWGMITLLDYKRASKPYRMFGLLQLRVLAPAHWSIGKLTRFLDADVRDVAIVLKRQAVTAPSAVGLWGRALRASPASTSQFSFRRHVEAFLRANGTEIWGRRFDVPLHIRLFHRAAKITARAS